jgi:hypothetical protein
MTVGGALFTLRSCAVAGRAWRNGGVFALALARAATGLCTVFGDPLSKLAIRRVFRNKGLFGRVTCSLAADGWVSCEADYGTDLAGRRP